MGIFIMTGAYLLMLLAMFILPFLMVPDQSVIKNTISDLGAQYSPYSRIINPLMVALAVSSVMSGWRFYEDYDFHRVILLLFGLSLALAAVFNHAPVSHAETFNIIEDGWHSYLINTAWLSFIILTFSTSRIQENPGSRLWSVITGLSAISLLLLVKEANQIAGIWQRLQFIISFAWMMYTYKKTDL